MLSAAKAKKNRKELLAQIEHGIETKHRKTVAELRRQASRKRGALRDMLLSMGEWCELRITKIKYRAKRALNKALDSLAELYPRGDERKKLRAAEERLRYRVTLEDAREACRQKKAAVKETFGKDLSAVEEAIAAELLSRREVKQAEAFGRRRHADRATKRERVSEKDEAVEVNLDPAHLPIWRRVKNKIRATQYSSRLEEFQRYLEEHPDEVYQAQEALAEQQMRRDLARQAREAREELPPMKRTRAARPARPKKSEPAVLTSAAEVAAALGAPPESAVLTTPEEVAAAIAAPAEGVRPKRERVEGMATFHRAVGKPPRKARKKAMDELMDFFEAVGSGR